MGVFDNERMCQMDALLSISKDVVELFARAFFYLMSLKYKA